MKSTASLANAALMASLAITCISPSFAFSPISLTTRSKISQTPPNQLYEFLASPANWPKIVASSSSVEAPSSNNTRNNVDLSSPLPQGQSVNEIFGLPPLFPLSVTWKCVKSIPPTNNGSAGRLEFYSVDGVPGIASRCKMNFDIKSSSYDDSSDGVEGSDVSFEMEYEPQSPLAILATPILTLDNALALKVLLPSALQLEKSNRDTTDDIPLDKFRSLMGTLYGVASIAHFFDLVFGGSQLIVAAGAPTFESLPLQGQVLALVWCLVGPISFVTSRLGGKIADIGLILYGLVEVGGAGVIRFGGGTVGDLDPFVNAIVVQGIVALAWLYSSSKKDE